jgi:toxin CcdB
MIHQFDLFANPAAEDAAHRPFLVALQSDLVSELAVAIVAPLVRREHMAGAHRLNPLVAVAEEEFWLATHELFALDRRMLRGKIASLAHERDKIIAALDTLFTGF